MWLPTRCRWQPQVAPYALQVATAGSHLRSWCQRPGGTFTLAPAKAEGAEVTGVPQVAPCLPQVVGRRKLPVRLLPRPMVQREYSAPPVMRTLTDVNKLTLEEMASLPGALATPPAGGMELMDLTEIGAAVCTASPRVLVVLYIGLV
jgi:hypothetical protein